MDRDHDRELFHVHRDVSLPALCPLSGIAPRRPAALRGLHQLTVDRACRRLLRTACEIARMGAEGVKHPRQNARAAPRVEMDLGRLKRRKAPGNRSPLASPPEHELDPVEDLPHVEDAGTPQS